MFKVATIATVLALALRASAFIVSTPASMTTCASVEFDIQNGNPSDQYTAYIVNGNDPCGPEIDHVDGITGSSFNWTVKVPAGTAIMVALDNGQDEQWSGSVTVTAGDTSCLSSTTTTTSSGTTSSTPTAHAGATYTAPVNVASSGPSATVGSSTSGSSRVAFGISSAFAVLGMAAVGLTL